MTDPIERMAQAMYDDAIASHDPVCGHKQPSGSREHVCMECATRQARAAFASLVPEGDALEAAAKAVGDAGVTCGLMDGNGNDLCGGENCSACANMAHTAIQAAAPLLIAPYVAELERAKGERDEARATKDMFKERRQELVLHLATAERERDAARAEVDRVKDVANDLVGAILAMAAPVSVRVSQCRRDLEALLTPSAS